MSTKISWTDASWQPVVGCSKVSEGCKFCYAERMAARLWRMGRGDYGSVLGIEDYKWNNEIFCRKDFLDKPLHWRKPRRIFVCSMGDLFHEQVPFSFISRVFDTIIECPQHIFQILTKRPERMETYLWDADINNDYTIDEGNVCYGVTVESDKHLDRIIILRGLPTAKTFISIEPCLSGFKRLNLAGINLVIVGCESIPGGRAGRFQDGFIDAAIDIVAQCDAAGVKVHVKQIPINGKVSHKMSEWPEELRRQEMI